MAHTLSIISIVSFVISAICLALAVFCWFAFNIPGVIGDLSGRTARKSIAQMREQNEKSGSKSYKTSSTNVERGKLTDTMQHSMGLKGKKKSGTLEEKMPETGLLEENKSQRASAEQTGLLTGEEATVLFAEENETAPLVERTVYDSERTGGRKITMLEEVILIHTDEVIG